MAKPVTQLSTPHSIACGKLMSQRELILESWPAVLSGSTLRVTLATLIFANCIPPDPAFSIRDSLALVTASADSIIDSRELKNPLTNNRWLADASLDAKSSLACVNIGFIDDGLSNRFPINSPIPCMM